MSAPPHVPLPGPQALLGAPPAGRLGSAVGRALYWHYRMFRARKYAQPVLEHPGGVPLIVTPQVMNPCLTRAGAFFASQLHGGLLGAEVLDMGTGSGVCAVRAARHARRVVAVDISPEAARCARINILLNRLEDRVEVLQGDLFAPVIGQRFDVVLFNPPFLAGEPRDEADRAWRCIDVPERFAQGLVGHLKPGGFALLLLSTYGDCGRYIEQLRMQGLTLTTVAQRRYVNEVLTLVKACPPGSGT
jgi:release factor glutamine methyltransferase